MVNRIYRGMKFKTEVVLIASIILIASIFKEGKKMKKTRLKKAAVLAATTAILTASLCACGGEKKEDTTAAAATEAAAQDETAASAVFFTINGAEVRMGAAWADIKDSLGAETKPSDTIQPCDGGDYIQIVRYYEGAELTTLRDETVIGISMTMDGGGDVAIMGKVKKGDTTDAAKSALGTPASEDEGMMSYDMNGDNLMIYLENGAVTGAMCMASPQ